MNDVRNEDAVNGEYFRPIQRRSIAEEPNFAGSIGNHQVPVFIDAEHAMRMGVHLGRVKELELRTINELFLLTQPSHLTKILGRKLEGDHRRAEFIRQRLNVN